jgi:hypothetical protein
MNVCSRLDLFQTGRDLDAVFGEHLERSQLRLGLVGEAVSDAKGESFKCQH